MKQRGQVLFAISAFVMAIGWGNGYGGTDVPDARIERLLMDSLGGEYEAAYWLPDDERPARAREAIGILYLSIEGAAGGVDIAIGYFRRQGSVFRLAGRVEGLFGADPRECDFLPNRIELTTTMPKPGDPRCCPTGTARWAIDRTSLKATRLR